MSVWGLPNVLRILDDIDKGKLQRYTFIECHACFEGCVSGALTVENPYVARARALRLQQSLPKRDPGRSRRHAGAPRAGRVPDDGAVRRPPPAAARPRHRHRHHPDAGARPRGGQPARDRLRRVRLAHLRHLRRGRRDRRGRAGAVRRPAAGPARRAAGAADGRGRAAPRWRTAGQGGPAMTVTELARLAGRDDRRPGRTPARARCAAATPRTCCRMSWPTRRTATRGSRCSGT
ncbi:MAG: hypothetical protein MZV70_15840 [Desulfobacterales bacterium]|nr:hypothetical protein [Desulfobacterales bacterium]